MGTLLGLSPGAGLGDFGRAGRVIFKVRWGQFMEATAGGPGGSEQSVGQRRHQDQGAHSEDGGGGRARLDIKEQQGVDGQRWGGKWLSFTRSTNVCSPSPVGGPPPHTEGRPGHPDTTLGT